MNRPLKFRNSALVTICTPDYLSNALTALFNAYKYNKEVNYCLLYLDYNIPTYLKKIKNLR